MANYQSDTDPISANYEPKWEETRAALGLPIELSALRGVRYSPDATDKINEQLNLVGSQAVHYTVSQPVTLAGAVTFPVTSHVSFARGGSFNGAGVVTFNGSWDKFKAGSYVLMNATMGIGVENPTLIAGTDGAAVKLHLKNGNLLIENSGVTTGFVGLGHSLRTLGRAQVWLSSFDDADGEQSAEVLFGRGDLSTENNIRWDWSSRYNSRVGGHDGNKRITLWEGPGNDAGTWMPRLTIMPNAFGGRILIGGNFASAEPNARLEVREGTASPVGSNGPILLLTGGVNNAAVSTGETNWTSLAMRRDGTTNIGRLSTDANGLFVTANAKWTDTLWLRDDITKPTFAIIEHLTNSQLEFRVAPAAANPITWTTAFIIDSIGNIGMGVVPIAPLHLQSSPAGAAPSVIIDRYSNDIIAPFAVTRKARGTASAPTAVQANDNLGGTFARGYHSGGSFSAANMVAVKFFASENFTTTAQGTYITFDTTPNGSVSREERVRIDHAGNVGFGITLPEFPIDVGRNVGVAPTAIIATSQYSSDTFGAVFLVRKARGSIASPSQVLANDDLGGLFARGYHSGGAFSTTNNAAIKMLAAENFTSTAQGTYIEIGTTPIGSVTRATRMTIYSTGGATIGAPTGGDKGAGTLNAVAVYDDNVLLSDFVFDKYFDGNIKEYDRVLHDGYEMLSLDEMIAYVKENRHLPTMVSREQWKNKTLSLGELVSRLWETVETQALYIKELKERIWKLG